MAKVAAATAQQARLAQQCRAILHVSGMVGDEGDHLVLPHEPATPLSPGAALAAGAPPEIETLWWLTGVTLRALEAAAAAKVLHGSIHLGTLYLDETGRLKLGDFGLAPAFEGACGPAARRWVQCDAALGSDGHGRATSGLWRLAAEDEAHEHGWIAPYWAHELLQETGRLTLKADQFALGVLLYLLATGVHPYGANLSDPSLNFYFHLEPAPLEEERREWAPAFEHRHSDLPQPADTAVLAWAEIVTRLLASAPEARSAASPDRDELVRQHFAPAWGEASTAIDQATAKLDDGDVEGFFGQLAQWKDNEALPAIWRGRLQSWVARIDSQKEVIGARKARQRRLLTAQQALDQVELGAARSAARELLADPEAEESVRQAAEEVLRHADEQESFVESGADAVAVAYLDSARQTLASFEFEAAQQVLQGLMQDPAMPPARIAQARQLLGEVELAAQRAEQQRAELEAAGKQDRAGDLDGARSRLEALLGEPDLAPGVTERGRALLDEVCRKQQQRAAWAAALDAAEKAWQQADGPAVREQLEQVPAEVEVAELGRRRQRVAEALARLEAATEAKRAAEQSLERGQPKEAADAAGRAAKVGELPAPLRAALEKLAARCQAAIEQREQAALAAARAALEQARQGFQRGDATECRRWLGDRALEDADVPEAIRHEGRLVLADCQRLERGNELLDQAAASLGGEDFEAADNRLNQVDPKGLPASVVARIQKVRAAVNDARRAFRERQEQQVTDLLAQAKAAIERGQAREAKRALRDAEKSAFVTQPQRTTVAELRALLAQRRPRRDSRVPLAIGSAVVVVVACAAGWWMLRQPAAPQPPEPTPEKTLPVASENKSPPAVVTPPATASTPVVASRPAEVPPIESAPAVVEQPPHPPPETQPTEAVQVEEHPPPATQPSEVVQIAEQPPPAETQPTEVTPPEEQPPAVPPVATFAAAMEELVAALRAALGGEVEGLNLRGEPTEPLTVEAGWRSHRLVPFEKVAFDAEKGTFSVAPEQVIAWFRLQIDALAKLTGGQGLTVHVAEAYDAAVVAVANPDARIVALAPEGDRLDVVTAGRLRNDPRSAARFELSGGLSGDVLTADAAGRAAFDAYLRTLQQAQAAAAADALAADLHVPEGVRLARPEDLGGGPDLQLKLVAGTQDVAELSAAWDVPSLSYVIDQVAARQKIQAGVRRLMDTEATRSALRASWPAVAGQLATDGLPAGAGFFRRCVLLDVSPSAAGGDELFTVPVQVALGPENAPLEERFSIPAAVTLAGGKLDWDVAKTLAARPALSGALDELAASEKLRQRRAEQAVAKLVAEERLPRESLRVSEAADVLTATVTDSGRRYTWTWEPQELEYGGLKVQEPPTLAARLAALAETPEPAVGDFVAALRDVTARKLEGYGAAEYRLGPELADSAAAPDAVLVGISRAVQALVAPKPAADPLPVVFVEYYVGPQDAYALAWHARTQAGDTIVAAADLTVWRVMTTAELQSSGDPEAFRQRYAADAEFGERLLGHALGPGGAAASASAGGSFGVLVAPHEALWSVRWDQVQFQPRPIQGLAGRGAPGPGPVRSLRAILAPHVAGREAPKWRRAGLWCVPTLGGEWRGPPATEQMHLAIGNLNAGQTDFSLRFKTTGPDNLLLALIELPPLGGFEWGTYATQLHRNEIGYTFWNRGWEQGGPWQRKPQWSFALLRVAGD